LELDPATIVLLPFEAVLMVVLEKTVVVGVP
jgi:hypothetical protein